MSRLTMQEIQRDHSARWAAGAARPPPPRAQPDFVIERNRQRGGDPLPPCRREAPLAGEARCGISERDRAPCSGTGAARCAASTPLEDGVRPPGRPQDPAGWGGSDDPENLQPLCEECNRGKNALRQPTTIRRTRSGPRSAATASTSGSASCSRLSRASPVRSDVLEMVASPPGTTRRTGRSGFANCGPRLGDQNEQSARGRAESGPTTSSSVATLANGSIGARDHAAGARAAIRRDAPKLDFQEPRSLVGQAAMVSHGSRLVRRRPAMRRLPAYFRPRIPEPEDYPSRCLPAPRSRLVAFLVRRSWRPSKRRTYRV